MLKAALLLILATATILVSSTADAVVLCAKPRADGTYNTSVKIREACKVGETQLDAAQIGVQGPPGPAGPSEAWVGETDGRVPMFAGPQVLGTVDVPAGEYVVQSFVRLLANPGAADASIACELIASPIGTVADAGWAPMTHTTFEQYDLPLLGWARLPGGGTISLECDAFTSDLLDLRLGYNISPIVATRVGSVLPLPPPPGD